MTLYPANVPTPQIFTLVTSTLTQCMQLIFCDSKILAVEIEVGLFWMLDCIKIDQEYFGIFVKFYRTFATYHSTA